MNRRIPTEKQQLVVDIARGMENEPGKEKLVDAMEYVLRDQVNIEAGTVKSGSACYTVHATFGCDCPDARIKGNQHCKHTVAMEMQRRLENQLEGNEMPAKKDPQTEWEANVQAGGKPALLVKELEPDDIPDPEVPSVVEAVAKEVYGNDSHIRSEGHRYADYPSTLYIERKIGETKLGWTFRGTDDEDVWKRAIHRVRIIKQAAEASKERETR